jgi:ectoine hydroxylase-related dioxygenase (phytanoyl-CoA dioxygenase family)
MDSPNKFLAEHGICAVEPPYDTETIRKWNQKVNPILNSQDISVLARRYVNAQQLYETGLLDEIFNEKMRALIAHLLPDSVLYHCHIFEIDGNQSKPWLRAGNGLQGWHRDEMCLPYYEPGKPNSISIFIYMTDVGPVSGPFEIANYPPQKLWNQIAGRPCYKMVGEKSYTFIFNRTYIHRASVNEAPIQRRVLKLSLQPSELPNTRIGLPEFVNVLEAIRGQDVFLEHLFGGECDQKKYVKVIEKYKKEIHPKTLYLEENSTIDIAPLHEFKLRLKSALLRRHV